MEKLISPQNIGGAPYFGNDFVMIQDNIFAVLSGMFSFITDAFIQKGVAFSNINTIALTCDLSAGQINIDGETYEFTGYSGTYPCYILPDTDNITQRNFKDGIARDFIVEKILKVQTTIPSSGNYISILKTSSNTPYTNQRLEYLLNRYTKKIGDIQPYTGSLTSFTTTGLGFGDMYGFALCNGTNGTANLKGRFLVGYDPGDADYNSIGDTGGAKTVALTKAHIPPHIHRYVDRYVEAASGAIPTDTAAANTTQQTFTTEDGTLDGVGSGGTGGNGAPHENRPPFYTLAFYQRIS